MGGNVSESYCQINNSVEENCLADELMPKNDDQMRFQKTRPASDSKEVLISTLTALEEERIAVPEVFAAKNGIAAYYNALWYIVHFCNCAPAISGHYHSNNNSLRIRPPCV